MTFIRCHFIVFACLATVLPGTALASTTAAEDLLINKVYAQGGHTLYCATAFNPGDRIKIDYIYSEKQLLQHFGCITARQCASKPGFRTVADDLHNMYPIERAVELDRRGSQFGDLPADVEIRECRYQMSFQTFSPPDDAKGNVARAMLYMHVQHKLPLIGPLEMYQRWSRLDPPDDAELRRNAVIDQAQRIRNPYIDNPHLVDRLTGLPGR